MVTVPVTYPCCDTDKIYRHGKARSGEQQYHRSRECHHCFQLDYRYEANKLGVAEKIIAMVMNDSGVRDTSRVLGISITTVIAHLKNSTHQPPHRSPLTK